MRRFFYFFADFHSRLSNPVAKFVEVVDGSTLASTRAERRYKYTTTTSPIHDLNEHVPTNIPGCVDPVESATNQHRKVLESPSLHGSTTTRDLNFHLK